jgi:PAT family beta-lactamase induction signal transducer AmpG
MQFILAGVFAALAMALKMPSFIVPAVILHMMAALAGATRDLVTDGVCVTTLGNKHMAAFSGAQSMSWSIGPIVASSALVLLKGVLAGEKAGMPKPPVSANTSAWLVTLIVLAVLMASMGLWHRAFLSQGSRAADAPKTLGDGVRLFGCVFVTFFQKKDVLKRIEFAFSYRFGLGLLDKKPTRLSVIRRDWQQHGGAYYEA